MTTLRTPVYDSKLFDVSNRGDHVTLVTESSMLRHAGHRGLRYANEVDHPFRRAYDDACDEGLSILSGRTGRVVRFVVTSVDMDGDEVAGWRLEPVAEDRRLVDRPTDVLVIND